MDLNQIQASIEVAGKIKEMANSAGLEFGEAMTYLEHEGKYNFDGVREAIRVIISDAREAGLLGPVTGPEETLANLVEYEPEIVKEVVIEAIVNGKIVVTQDEVIAVAHKVAEQSS